MKAALFATLLLGLMTAGATAQPVYRCGSVYTQTPCPQGKIVEATDPRTAAQRAEAVRVAASERRLAADMRRERLADQLASKPSGSGSLSGTPPVKTVEVVERVRPKKKRVLVKPAPTTDFIAVDPARRK
jgi:hypothetical protein